MALNLRRWIEYAKSKAQAGLASGHEELDRREAELEARRAHRPEMSDNVEPSIDEVRAKIEWELERSTAGSGAAGQPGGHDGPEDPSPDDAEQAGTPGDPTGAPDAGGPGGATSGSGAGASPDPEGDQSVEGPPAEDKAKAGDGDDTKGVGGPGRPVTRSPEQLAADAEAEQASIEWEARREATADRLADIRRELGIE